MKVTEIIYQSFDSFERIIEVEFVDDQGNQLSDQISYDDYIDFGYDDDSFETSDFDEDSEWEDFLNITEIDLDSLTSFLNEYYTEFPDRIPDINF
jgi:hypothetical protein